MTSTRSGPVALRAVAGHSVQGTPTRTSLIGCPLARDSILPATVRTATPSRPSAVRRCSTQPQRGSRLSDRVGWPMQNWVNRLGLTLQFLSLWLVTPQIVGESALLKVGDRARELQQKLTRFISARRV